MRRQDRLHWSGAGLSWTSMVASPVSYMTDPFYASFCLIASLFLPGPPYSADCLMIWYNPRDSSQHHEPSGLHPYQLWNPRRFSLKWFLQFLHNRLIIRMDEVYFFSLSLLLPDQSGRSMSQYGFFLVSSSCPWSLILIKVLSQVILPK